MNRLKFILIGVVLVGSCSIVVNPLRAQQRKVFTTLEAGGILGLNKQQLPDGEETLNGYRLRITVGRNFNDRYFLGFGLGNEVYRASRRPDALFSNRFGLLPLFADLRAMLAEDFLSGELLAIGSAGYAPRLGNDTFKGALGHVGLSYGYPLSFERNGSTLNLSLVYGFQQIVIPYGSSNLQQHSVMLTVGLFLK